MTADTLFDLEPSAVITEAGAPSPPAEAAPARTRAARPRDERKRLTRPRNVLKVACHYRCGWQDKVPLGGLDRFGELATCPRCRRVAAIVVIARQSR